MSLELQSRVIKIISDTLNVPISELNENSSPESISQWESMKHINIILSIEEEFNLQFDDEQIMNLRNVKSIVHLIETMT